MNTQTSKFLIACAFFLAALPASAQTVGDVNEIGNIETRATVGITIPFGGGAHTAQGSPRFDLTVETAQLRRRNANGFSNPNTVWPERRNVRRSMLSWTIEDRPRFLLNGRMLRSDFRLYANGNSEQENEGERSERSTGKKVLRGAAIAGGVVLLVAGIGVAAIALDCNSDDGCGE